MAPQCRKGVNKADESGGLKHRNTLAGIAAVLEGVSQDTDRDTPIVFTGRAEELAKFTKSVNRAAQKEAAPKGNTIVVEGPPGAGKTAILHKFAEQLLGEMLEGEDGVKRMVLPVILQHSQLAQPAQLLCRDMTSSMRRLMVQTPRKMNEMREHLNDGVEMAFILNTDNNKFDLHEKKHGIKSNSDHPEMISAYAQDMWPPNLIIPLLVDEAQNIPDTKHARSALTCLHENNASGARIIPVFFGLPNTLTHLGALGLSRLSRNAVTHLGCLNKGEGRRNVADTFKHLGVDWDCAAWRGHLKSQGFLDEATWERCKDALVQQLADASGDFPQHLTVGVQETAGVLFENLNSMPPQSWRAFRMQIEKRHAQGRVAYYDARLAHEDVEPHVAALAAMAHLMPEDGIMPLSSAERVVRDGSEGEMTLSDAKTAVKALINRGLLTNPARGSAGPSPIPSMQRHLRSEFGKLVERNYKPAIDLSQVYEQLPKTSTGDEKESSTRHTP